MMVRAQPRRPKFVKEIVKRGRRRDGGIYVLADGREVYCAYRKNAEICRGNEKSISDAVRKRVAGWSLDDDTLRYMQLRGIKIIAVDVEESGDKFITSIDSFYTPGMFTWLFDKYRRGETHRCVNLLHWRARSGKVKFK
jgi:hypothetical protein